MQSAADPFQFDESHLYVTLVLIACVLGFGFTGNLQGVREGTIAAAVLVGMLVRAISKRKDALQRRFRKNDGRHG